MLQSLRIFEAFRPTSLAGLGADPATVAAMAAGITQMEGFIPPNAQYPKGSLAYQNNNPGNLVYAGQPGASPGAGGFAYFNTLAAGQAALNNQIAGQIDKGQSTTQFFNQYAPCNTTNGAGAVQTCAATQNYINTIASQLGVDPNTPLNGASVPTTYDVSSSGVQSTSTFDITDPTTWDTTEFAAIGVLAATVLYLLVSD